MGAIPDHLRKAIAVGIRFMWMGAYLREADAIIFKGVRTGLSDAAILEALMQRHSMGAIPEKFKLAIVQLIAGHRQAMRQPPSGGLSISGVTEEEAERAAKRRRIIDDARAFQDRIRGTPFEALYFWLGTQQGRSGLQIIGGMMEIIFALATVNPLLLYLGADMTQAGLGGLITGENQGTFTFGVIADGIERLGYDRGTAEAAAGLFEFLLHVGANAGAGRIATKPGVPRPGYVDPKSLKIDGSTQPELFDGNIQWMRQQLRDPKTAEAFWRDTVAKDGPITIYEINGKRYIFNGNHRYLAALEEGVEIPEWAIKIVPKPNYGGPLFGLDQMDRLPGNK